MVVRSRSARFDATETVSEAVPFAKICAEFFCGSSGVQTTQLQQHINPIRESNRELRSDV